MLCKESGNIRQREDYLSSLLCLFALHTKVETSSREKTTYFHFSVSMICNESGNNRQREDYLPSLICLYALQRKWKYRAERRLPSFTSLSLCSANEVEASSREKTTYLHFSVPLLCKESGNIRQGEHYLASLLCPYALQRKWKHQAEIRLPSFASLSLCSAKKVETSGREKTT